MTAAQLLYVAAGLIVGCAFGFFFGEHRGFSRGEASGWVESYFENVRKDRARRDRCGRFKEKKGRQ